MKSNDISLAILENPTKNNVLDVSNKNYTASSIIHGMHLIDTVDFNIKKFTIFKIISISTVLVIFVKKRYWAII